MASDGRVSLHYARRSAESIARGAPANGPTPTRGPDRIASDIPFGTDLGDIHLAGRSRAQKNEPMLASGARFAHVRE